MNEVTMQQIEERLTEVWGRLVRAVDSFTDDEMEQPGVVVGWSVKDLLGHIAFWNQRPVLYLEAILHGNADDVEMPKEGDAWNEREWKRRKDLPLATVRQEWLDSFEAVRRVLATFPVERLAERIQGRPASLSFAADTLLHYQEHLIQIEAWRRELETTEE